MTGISVVLCSTAFPARVRPMLAVARGLGARGWRVRFITGECFAPAVAGAGAVFVPLPAGKETGALRATLAVEPADAVLAEMGYLGAGVVATMPARARPALVWCGVTPVPRTGRMPAADLVALFTVPGFEFESGASPDRRAFVGPMSRAVGTGRADTWRFRHDRPVVHVTQGTSANRDWSPLVASTLRALADEPVNVLVATGGRALDTLPPLPPNAIATEFLRYGDTLPRCDVFVTNGGYAGLHAAMEHGLPIVVAGADGHRAEAAARVRHAGVGIDLGNGRTAPAGLGFSAKAGGTSAGSSTARAEGTPAGSGTAAIRRAVRQVLRDPRYGEASRAIGDQIRASPGVGGLAARVEHLVRRRVTI